MKVLVTNPPWPGPGYGVRSDVRWPHKRKDKYIEYPLYLGYTVAVLKEAGIDACFLDGIVDELSIDDFSNAAAKIRPDMVVIECSTPSIDYDLATAKALKEKLPNLFTVLLGSHPTFFHKEILEENPFVDGICRGEFEYTLRDLALSLSKNRDISKVDGLSWRDASGIHFNPQRPLVDDLDEIPFPDRDIVKIEPYQTAHYGGLKGTSVCTSRGCPYGCTYCLWPNTMYGKKFRARSPENVVEELQQLEEKYDVKEIYFDDDTINFNKARLIKICQLIRERGIKLKWFCQARVDKVDEELLKEMKAAGCYNIFFGVESGSQRIIDKIKKGIKLEDAQRAFALCRKLGIKTQAFFLLGIPGETQAEMKQTVEFAKSLKPSSAQFAIVVPHPGTKLYEECKSNGWLRVNQWKDFAACNAIIETENFSKEDVDTIRLYAHRHFYFRPTFIFDTLKRMSNLRETRKVFRGAKSIIGRLLFYR
ncbi:MAG: radical SAM protein [Candidatus Omnitrophota bacterium]